MSERAKTKMSLQQKLNYIGYLNVIGGKPAPTKSHKKPVGDAEWQ
jgi:hypothetical protein